MKQGIDYVGVGVGGMIFNTEGKVFLAQRGEKATNERGCWEFPGGKVDFGERLQPTLIREFAEEFGMVIEIERLLDVHDHILEDEGQHWVSPTYIGRHVSGEPCIMEPEKCSAIGWFNLDDLPSPLSMVSAQDILVFRKDGK